MESNRSTDLNESTLMVKVWHGLEFLGIPKGPIMLGSPVDDDQIDDDEKPQYTLTNPTDSIYTLYTIHIDGKRIPIWVKRKR